MNTNLIITEISTKTTGSFTDVYQLLRHLSAEHCAAILKEIKCRPNNEDIALHFLINLIDKHRNDIAEVNQLNTPQLVVTACKANKKKDEAKNDFIRKKYYTSPEKYEILVNIKARRQQLKICRDNLQRKNYTTLLKALRMIEIYAIGMHGVHKANRLKYYNDSIKGLMTYDKNFIVYLTAPQ